MARPVAKTDCAEIPAAWHPIAWSTARRNPWTRTRFNRADGPKGPTVQDGNPNRSNEAGSAHRTSTTLWATTGSPPFMNGEWVFVFRVTSIVWRPGGRAPIDAVPEYIRRSFNPSR